ncbi:MAG: class I SAM-dependent methyltransferase [Candidatus Aureabacteria bacterium]|nr:class I SAM-dependent methyltransferase [Candidatus Auribacterota bacterium]
MKKASRQYRLLCRIKRALEFAYMFLCRCKSFIFVKLGFFSNEKEKDLNQLLVGYPHNHNYAVYKKKLFHSFQLYERYKLVSSAFPEKLTSFIDIGSCKGYYVLNAAMQQSCKISTGVDIHKPFISISKKVKDHLEIKNASFFLGYLEDICDNPQSFGGPFQTVLLIGTYQYLFWGSGLSQHAYFNHREILLRLSRICTERVILSARLETGWLSSGVKEKAKLLGSKITYTTDDFIKTAEEFFNIETAGYLGKYPLFIMKKKNLGE